MKFSLIIEDGCIYQSGRRDQMWYLEICDEDFLVNQEGVMIPSQNRKYQKCRILDIFVYNYLRRIESIKIAIKGHFLKNY